MSASSSLPLPPRKSPRKWRFTWEALTHIPTLRLFLFNSEVDPSDWCENLKASLRLEDSRLLVSWTEKGAGDSMLRVPVPRVLIDPGSPVEPVAKEDHIEVKLALVLPLDHPIIEDFCSSLDLGREGGGKEEGFSDRFLPLSLDSDLKSLCAGDVHLFCKTCSTRLTRKPLRDCVEMPSANWREVADNWFGACCCSFGGISEKLVYQYTKSYTCTEGKCLLDGTSVIICKDDLDGYIFQKQSDEHARHNDRSDLLDKGDITDVVEGLGFPERKGICCVYVNESNPDICDSPNYLPHKGERLTTDTTQVILNETQLAVNAESGLNSNLISGYLENSSSDTSAHLISSKKRDHCCVEKTNDVFSHAHGRSFDVSITSSKAHQFTENSMPLIIQKRPHIVSLGSGFMIKPSNLLNDVEWIEFLCRNCSSLLGSYPSTHGLDTPLDGGIRLFKCYVSTSMSVGGSHDIFRKHTLQRVFVNFLLENAADELSFRTVVRDLSTKSPRLQIILLNSKVWCCTDDCFENETSKFFSEVNLQPVVKVQFSDSTVAPEATSRKCYL